jgi:L-ribulokinase
MELFEEQVRIDTICTCGGIAEKDPFLLQIFADITNREIKLAASSQTAALGAAMYASVAAGAERGGYNSISEAVSAMSQAGSTTYKPNPENHYVYNRLYTAFKELGSSVAGNGIMQILDELRHE